MDFPLVWCDPSNKLVSIEREHLIVGKRKVGFWFSISGVFLLSPPAGYFLIQIDPKGWKRYMVLSSFDSGNSVWVELPLEIRGLYFRWYFKGWEDCTEISFWGWLVLEMRARRKWSPLKFDDISAITNLPSLFLFGRITDNFHWEMYYTTLKERRAQQRVEPYAKPNQVKFIECSKSLHRWHIHRIGAQQV